jgi:hypothetical protein
MPAANECEWARKLDDTGRVGNGCELRQAGDCNTVRQDRFELLERIDPVLQSNDAGRRPDHWT